MKVWQIACGTPERDFRDVFLQHDVMLIGPGDPGKFSEKCYRAAFKAGKVERSHVNQIRAFQQKTKPGDLVLLRCGHDVIRIGKIPEEKAGGYDWGQAFNDILGWDLQHYRRVIWGNSRSASLLQGRKAVFSNYKQQPTFTGVNETRITRLANRLDKKIPSRRLKNLPQRLKGLPLDEVGIQLFQAGLANDSVERAIDAIEKATRLERWYKDWKRSGDEPSEHEIIAHITIPLMLSLGWSEQLLAVEWDKVDLAFFDKAPRSAKNCVMICEAKRPHTPLEAALGQAKEYVKRKGLHRCRRILLTSGSRILSYRRRANNWALDGYINLGRINDTSLIPRRIKAVDTLINLLPSKVR